MAFFHLALALMMVITGSINTIVTKYADLFCSNGLTLQNDCHNPHECKGTTDNLTNFWNTSDALYCAESTYIKNLNMTEEEKRIQLKTFTKFDHPFVQAFTMFVGEFCCLIAYYITRKRPSKKSSIYEDETEALLKPDGSAPEATPKWSPVIWALPAACDACATTTMYIGLTLTHASDFQMLRGSVVIFTGFFSVIFLKRKLVFYHWSGMVLVLVGLLLVGVTGFLEGSGGSSAPNPVLGDAIIIAAQVIVATQMVVEEKLMKKYKVPVLCAVGWEGFFGMIYMVCLSTLITYVGHPSLPPSWNMFDGILQIYHNFVIGLVLLGTVCSIAFFNFSGLSVTKEMSATTRMVLDSIRTIVIWVFCLAAPKPYDSTPLEVVTKYTPIEVAGFVVLLLGTFVYNERECGAGIVDKHGKPKKETLVAPVLRMIGIMGPAKSDIQMDGFADSKGSIQGKN